MAVSSAFLEPPSPARIVILKSQPEIRNGSIVSLAHSLHEILHENKVDTKTHTFFHCLLLRRAIYNCLVMFGGEGLAQAADGGG